MKKKLENDFSSLGLNLDNYISFEGDTTLVKWDAVLNYEKLEQEAKDDFFPPYFKSTFVMERIKEDLLEAGILSERPEGNYAIIGENGFDNLKAYRIRQIPHPNPTMYDTDPYIKEKKGELFFTTENNANGYAHQVGDKTVVKINKVL